MNPSQPPVPPRPAAPAAGAPAGAAAPSRGLPLGGVAWALAAAGVALSAGLGWGLAPVIGGGAAAAVAAAVGVALAGAPLAWLAVRLRADIPPRQNRAGSGAAPAAGVPRELFMDLAAREFARARRYGTGAALLLVDVDRHARLAESRGPAAAEAAVAELLRQTAPTLRTADVLTRFGPSQVAIFLAHADATGALDVAERIRERTEQLELPGATGATAAAQRLRITVSAGVAHLRPAHLNLQALVDDAHDAVTAARGAGGNCVRAAPVDSAAGGPPGAWRDRRARPKQGGSG